MSRTLFIGDVHGCLEELEALLDACRWTKTDRVVLVGDLVAKGPSSHGVVQAARELNAKAVMGNHDRHLLRIRRKETPPKPFRTEHLEAAAQLTEADWDWLSALPYTLAFPDLEVMVVHAGFVPGVPVKEQQEFDLLNLRSITSEGKPAYRADDGIPWASVWKGPEHVVFGHDAKRGLQQHPFATGLDTGCVYGGSLTALVYPERRLLSVKAKKAYAPKGH